MAPIAIAAMMEHIGDISAISSTAGRELHRRSRPAPHPDGRRSGNRLWPVCSAAPPTPPTAKTPACWLSPSVYDPRVIRLAAVYAIILSFSPKFDALVNSIPSAIIGGVSFSSSTSSDLRHRRAERGGEPRGLSPTAATSSSLRSSWSAAWASRTA
ncbi:MAG: solute carrier family 23 protein [Evtepia sp.]